MKKSSIVLPVLLGAMVMLPGAVLEENHPISFPPDLSIRELPGETIDYPAAGVIDDASCMRSIWQSSTFGFKRLDDQRVAVTGSSGWGFRCDYGPTTFSRDRFEVSVDLTDFTRGDCLGLSFGPQGIYHGEAAQGLCMDIVKYSFDERNDYMVCLNPGSANADPKYEHNQSIEGWPNSEEVWLDSYKGAVVTAEDNVLNIGWTVTGEEVEIYVNDYSATFPVDIIFANLADEFCVNFCTGYQSGPRYFILNHCMDGDDMAYYNKETGTYYEVKKQVEDFASSVSNVTLDTVQDFIDAYALSEDVNLDELYSHDEVYLRRTFDPALEGLQSKAVEKFGNSTYVELLRYYVNQLNVLAEDLSTEENLLTALSKVDMINLVNGDIASLSLTEEEQQQVAEIRATFEEDYTLVQAEAGNRYGEIVNAVISQMNSAASLEEVRNAEIAYNSISTTFRGYMDAEALATLEASLEASRTAFIEKFSKVSEESGFISGNDLRVVEGESSIGLTAWGSTATSDQTGSGLLYTKEALDIIDFSADYTINHFGQYAISIMAEPTFFSAADDESIQNFKGFVFLVREVNETQASVQPYLIDGTCNRFFDGQLTQTDLIIDKEGDIHFELAVRQVNTSGIIENYLEFSFNGVKYETPLVREFEILGAFNNAKGYFGIGSQNGNARSPLTLTLNQINGNAVTSSSLVKKDISYDPVASSDSFIFELGDTNNLTIGVDPRLETGLRFYMDGTLLTSGEEYTYQRNTTLNLKADYLNTLAAGNHTLKLESDKGSSEITIVVQEKEAPVDPGSSSDGTSSSEGGNEPVTPPAEGGLTPGAIAGIVIGSLAGVGLIAGLLIYFLVKKSKKK